MSPTTSDAVTALRASQRAAPEWDPFTPQRFTGQERAR
jgi:hypothetical protein